MVLHEVERFIAFGLADVILAISNCGIYEYI